MTTTAVAIAISAIFILALATERVPAVVVSLVTIPLFVIAGVLTPAEAFAGFGSPVVIMVGGVMLMVGAMVHNGVPQLIVRAVQAVPGQQEPAARGGLIAAVTVVSAFINNVAATAMFIPVAEGIARRFRTDRGRYLIPVAFASMTGGLCTLVGTSTNVAVAGSMDAFGMEPLGLFELTPIGIPIAVLAGVYLFLVGPRITRTPGTPTESDSLASELREFLHEVRILEPSLLAGRTLLEADPAGNFGLTILTIHRGGRVIEAPSPAERIRPGDILLVRSRKERIAELAGAPGIRIGDVPRARIEGMVGTEPHVAEVTVSWGSPLVGKTLQETDFRHRFGASVLGIHRRTELLGGRLSRIPLAAGDVLLVYGAPDVISRLGQGSAGLLVSDVVSTEGTAGKAVVSSVIFVAAVAAVLAGLDPPTAFLAGGAMALALRCIPLEDVGRHLGFGFLVLLAALVTVGTALDRSGGAALVAELTLRAVGTEPLVLLAAMFVLTALLTQPLSNAAAALLVFPVAVAAAQAAGLDPRPFVIMVTLAGSCSFLTPFEPACLLVYGTGHYRFSDFPRVGLPLTIVALAVAVVLVPRIWPFAG